MQLYFAAIVSGIAVGGLYALVAVGITQIFSVTRVLNFAHAGFMMWGAYIYASLSYTKGWPVVPAAAVTIAIIGLMGLVAEIMIFRFAHKATTVNKILMTFGLLNALTAVAIMVFTRDTRVATSLFPPGGYTIFDTSISWQQTANLVAVAVVVVGMNWFLRRTRLGLQTRSMAENITMAELMGASRHRIGMLNWTLAAMVGGLAGVLAASLQPFAITQFAAYFVFALAATLVGGLSSLAWTAVGGIALGVIFNVATVARNDVGIGSLVIFIAVVALVLLRRNWPTELSKIGWTKPQTGEGRKDWAVNRVFVIGSWTAIVIAATQSEVWGFTAATIMVYTVAALSLLPLIGWTGQISLAQGGFMAIGAAAFAEANNYHELNLPVSLLVAIVAGALGGALLGLICYRLSFVQTAIVTLSFTGVIVAYFVYSPLTRGRPAGKFSIDVPGWIDTGRSAFVGFTVVAIVIGLALNNIRKSQWGITFISVRTAPDMARHFGLRPAFVRIAAFTLSGAIAAIAGVLYLLMLSIVDATSFGVGFALQILIFAVIGGTSSLWGPFVGPMVILAPPVALGLDRFGGAGWPDLLAGIFLIIFMATAPDGMVSLMKRPTKKPKIEPTAAASDGAEVERQSDLTVQNALTTNA